MNTTEYPRPFETSTNRPLLDAWKEGRLSLQHCIECGRDFYFPRPFCPHCWSTHLDWRDHSGQGRIVSFSRIHRHIHEAFRAESPTVIAEIRLEAGPLMLARVVGEVQQSDLVGASVKLVSPEQAKRFPLPTFQMA